MNLDETHLRSATTRGRRPVRRLATLVLAAFAMTATLTACPEKGPAEKAGEALDDAGEGIKDAVTPDGPAEDLGEKIDDATK